MPFRRQVNTAKKSLRLGVPWLSMWPQIGHSIWFLLLVMESEQLLSTAEGRSRERSMELITGPFLFTAQDLPQLPSPDWNLGKWRKEKEGMILTNINWVPTMCQALFWKGNQISPGWQVTDTEWWEPLRGTLTERTESSGEGHLSRSQVGGDCLRSKQDKRASDKWRHMLS